VPQAGLDGKVRAHPLAQLIVERIVKDNADPDSYLIFNPLQQSDAQSVAFAPNATWLDPIVHTVINGREDEFSPRYDSCSIYAPDSVLTAYDSLGSDCLDSYPGSPPSEPLFAGENVVIVSNGACVDVLSPQ